MRLMRRLLSVLLVAVVLGLGLSHVSAQDSAQQVQSFRFGHFIKDAPAVDLYIDKQLVQKGVKYGTLIADIAITVGKHELAVTATGKELTEANTAIGPLQAPLDKDRNYAFLLVGLVKDSTLQGWLIDESYAVDQWKKDPTITGQIFVNSLEGGQTLTLTANGKPTGDPVPLNKFKYGVIPAGQVSWKALSGSTKVEEYSYTAPDNVYGLTVYAGTPDKPDVYYYERGLDTIAATLADPKGATASKADYKFTMLLNAVNAANLLDTLSGTDLYTLYAPTDSAFNALPADQLNSLLKDKTALTNLLKNHIVAGIPVQTPDPLTTLQGGTLTWTQSGDSLVSDSGAKQLKSIRVKNGRIVIIDKVLLPATK